MSSSKKKHSPSNSAPASGLASSQVTHQLQSPTQSQSHSQSPQEKQQSQPVYPWSAHVPPSGSSLSPLRRHALSPSATATGELFLFGGYVHGSDSPMNDLYVISTRDFSTTPLHTSGDVPSPRCGHRAVFTSTILLIWGGVTKFSDENAQHLGYDDSLYLLNLVSREWTRIVVNGPGPGGRCYHTMTLVGSKLFVFGGKSGKRCLNDIWALDLDCLASNPRWESCEPVLGNERPLSRAGHVSVTTGDRIIIFGGCRGRHDFNDTWSFNISTWKWTELQCTGSIPSPRATAAAVLVDDVMYVFGGHTHDEAYSDDLAALNLSTQRWTVFQDIGPSPCGRALHAMASDGRRVFVLGGRLPPGAQVDEAKLIHVLDTMLLIHPKPPDASVKEIAPLEHERLFELERQLSETIVAQTERDQHIARLTDELALKSALLEQAAEEKNRAGLELRELQAKLNESLLSQDQAEANATETKKRAELEQRELQAKLDESLLSRDQAEADAAEAKMRAELEQLELQAKVDELLLSRDQALEQAQSALQKATLCAAEASERSQRELAEVHAKLQVGKSELTAVRLRLADTENGCSKSKLEAEADTYRNQNVTGLVNTNEDRVVHRLLERMQAMEVEMASLRSNEKSFEIMECRNEG